MSIKAVKETVKATKATELWPMNIAPELFEEWKRLRRQGDPEAIAKALDKSRPTITRALTYGHVNQKEIIDGINTFFSTRLDNERKMAKKLNKMSNEQITRIP